jgi:hypothetical protein
MSAKRTTGGWGRTAWLLSSALFAACGGDAVGKQVQPKTGTLFVPLEASTSSGVRYRLGSAELALSGSEDLTLDLSGESSSVETSLLIGPYSATLRPGWALLRLTNGGPEPVVAELRSPNPARFEIEQDETTSLTLRFRVNGRDVDLGDEEPMVTPDAGGGGPDDLGNPQFPGMGGSGAGGSGGGGAGDSGAGGGSSNGGGPATPEPGADAGATPIDSGVPGDNCSEPGARCIDDVLEQLTNAAPLPLCIPNDVTTTPLGDVTVCGNRTCSNGQAGCNLLTDTSASSASVRANGTVDISVVAQLNPTSVPVLLPAVPIFGRVTCNVGVSGAIVTTANAVPRFGSDGVVSGFDVGGSQTNLDGVVLTVQTAGFPCNTLDDALNGLRSSLAPQVNAAVQSSLIDLFDGIAGALACQRCTGACPLSCTQR